MIFTPDGKFKGNIESVRGGLLGISGTYKITGSEVMIEGIYDRAPAGIHGARFSMSLKQSGERLEGTVYSYATGRTAPVELKKTR